MCNFIWKSRDQIELKNLKRQRLLYFRIPAFLFYGSFISVFNFSRVQIFSGNQGILQKIGNQEAELLKFLWYLDFRTRLFFFFGVPSFPFFKHMIYIFSWNVGALQKYNFFRNQGLNIKWILLVPWFP